MIEQIIARARLLSQTADRGPVDIWLRDGTIARIEPADESRLPEASWDAAGGLVTRSFVDAHLHPDKALTHPRVAPLRSQTTDPLHIGALIKGNFTVADIARRAREAIETAVVQGVGAVRAQVDVDSAVGLRGMEALLQVREDLADIVDLQLVAFPQEGVVRDPSSVGLLREALTMGADVLGGGPDNEGSAELYAEHLRILFDLAAEFDVDLDLHADMAEDSALRATELIARTTTERGWQGRVNIVHCVALGSYPQGYAEYVIDLLASARIGICICPIGNLHVMGEGPVPRGRGASRPRELLAAGITVAAGTDNLHDMWFRFGNLDPVETARITCLSAMLRSDAEILRAYEMVTTSAARYLGIDHRGVEVGAPADLVMFDRDDLSDVLRGAARRRITLKAGRQVATWSSAASLTPLQECLEGVDSVTERSVG